MRFRIFFSIALAAALCLMAPVESMAAKAAKTAKTPKVSKVPNKFLLFPNPQVQADGSYQSNKEEYAIAYYQAIDPQNERETMDKWEAMNGFGVSSADAVEHSVIFGDTLDLGYGRGMRVRYNKSNNTLATYVKNYLVGGYSKANYNSMSLEAAAKGAEKYHPGSNAIEYSPGPGGTVNFVKFYNFDARTGKRNLMVDLDGRGPKAMPGVCSNCHGGRNDPLTPADASGKQLFPVAMNSLSLARGDIQGRMQPLKVDSFDFVKDPGLTREAQEATMKEINKIMLCTYPRSSTATVYPEDSCRPVLGVKASSNEWEGTEAAKFIKGAYGGDGMPNAKYEDTYVPETWSLYGQSTFYQKVVMPGCMTCHIVRGTGKQSDVDFTNYTTSFMPSATADPGRNNYLDRILDYVFEQGNMPLAKIVADKFWTTDIITRMANFMEAGILTQDKVTISLRNAHGKVIKPGLPIAEPGPDRVIRPGSLVLTGLASRFSAGYEWSIVSGATTATLTNADTISPTFSASADGTYVLQLVAKNGKLKSAPAQVKIVVDSALSYDPASLRFSNIKTLLQARGCTSCHNSTGGTSILYTDYDRNGDGVVNATDDQWFHAELRGRVNFTDHSASALLRKPSGHHHNGGLVTGFDNALTVGAAGRSDYDLIVNWIMSGAPY